MSVTYKRPFRFIYSGVHDGYTNMAMDEAVLTGLQKNLSAPLLRIYKWNPPTITLGYFQRVNDIDFKQCVKDGIGIVRRLTGGRAVLHFEELTYSILFTEEDFTIFKKREIFIFIARCLVDSLNLLGIKSKIAEKTRGNLKSPNCFSSPAQYEIESTDRKKLIGSAQVIKDGVVLQHGAIPFTNSYTNISRYLKCDAESFQTGSFQTGSSQTGSFQTGSSQTGSSQNATSLNQISKAKISESKLLDSLKIGFAKHLSLRDGDFTQYEYNLIQELTQNKYSQEEWLFKR